MAPGVLFCRKSNVSIPSKQQAGSLPQGGPPAAVAVCCKREKCKRILKAIPHNSKCRYGERGAADAKPKAQIILDAAKVSAASGGNSEPKQGQRSQSASGKRACRRAREHNRSRGSGRRVRGAFAPEARCGYRNPTLSSILATQMPCRSRRSGA